MSISAMSDAKLVRESPTLRTASPLEKVIGIGPLVERPPPVPRDQPQPVGVDPTVVQQLVRWIPTEIIALYVAWIALLNPVTAPAGKTVCTVGDFGGRWASVVAFAVATPIIVVAIHLTKVRATKQPFRWPLFEIGAAGVAFLAWAFALPDTPLEDFCGYKVEVGAFLVLGTSIAIGLVAGATGHEPTPRAAE